jgi:hypothetical protein
MLPPEVIVDRFRAMYHVATVIQSAWLWTVMSLAEMGSNLGAMRAKLELLDTAESEMLDARASLDNELAAYRTNIRAFLRVGKLRFRSQRIKYNLIKPLRMQGTGRDTTVKIGRKVEKAWKKVDQNFAPVPTATFGNTQDCRQRCVQYQDDYSMKETEWRDKLEDVQDFAAMLDRTNIEWYATATTNFPAGTRYGDLIRTMVPTNNSAVQPVGQAVIDVATSLEPGKVHLEYHAQYATSYRLWHKGPGATEWTLIADNVDGLVYLVTGLTAGEHRFQVAGSNSRGNGAVSTESIVTVAAAAVA